MISRLSSRSDTYVLYGRTMTTENNYIKVTMRLRSCIRGIDPGVAKFTRAMLPAGISMSSIMQQVDLSSVHAALRVGQPTDVPTPTIIGLQMQPRDDRCN